MRRRLERELSQIIDGFCGHRIVPYDQHADTESARLRAQLRCTSYDDESGRHADRRHGQEL